MDDEERSRIMARRAFERGVDTRVERRESKSSWVIPLVVSIIMSAAGLAATWGVNAQRLENLEQFQKDTKRDLSSIHTASEEDHTQLAVVSAQYAEIIRRLGEIDSRLQKK